MSIPVVQLLDPGKGHRGDLASLASHRRLLPLILEVDSGARRDALLMAVQDRSQGKKRLFRLQGGSLCRNGRKKLPR
jgi:hypothetical protein